MIIQHIPAKNSGTKQRVAAYCRVSSSHFNQGESFDVQKKHYTQYIGSNPEWETAGIYSDEGITGTSVRKRPGFQQMIADALSGKIDIILVKSISRFSRNAVECQRYARLLKEHRVRVLFEEESIDNLDPISDLCFSIRAAFAQEESRIISENVRWTYQKNFENGIYHRGNKRVLGYDEIDGQLVPNGDADTVRTIFALFVEGCSFSEIRKQLQRIGARRLRSTKPFDTPTLRRMLKNEIYVGDLCLCKSRPASFMNLRPDSPNGRTIWNDHHTPIIDRTTWNTAQQILHTLHRNTPQ